MSRPTDIEHRSLRRKHLKKLGHPETDRLGNLLLICKYAPRIIKAHLNIVHFTLRYCLRSRTLSQNSGMMRLVKCPVPEICFPFSTKDR